VQTKSQSIIEAAVSTSLGFLISGALTYWIFGVTVCKAAWVTAIFTVASVLRQYIVRRAFNRWHK
jgi:hypothetical protein